MGIRPGLWILLAEAWVVEIDECKIEVKFPRVLCTVCEKMREVKWHEERRHWSLRRDLG